MNLKKLCFTSPSRSNYKNDAIRGKMSLNEGLAPQEVELRTSDAALSARRYTSDPKLKQFRGLGSLTPRP